MRISDWSSDVCSSDLDRGYAFATYASTRIRGAMIDQLRREAEVGRSAMIASKRIQTVRRDLEQHLMRAPTAAEMADAFGMSAEEYFALEKNAAHGRSTSLDEMIDRSEEHTSELQSLMRIS